jgi:hypothetical protein
MAFVDLAPLVIIAFLIVLRVPRASILILGLILMQRRFEDGAIYPAVDPRAFYPRIPILDAIPRSEEPFRITAVGNAFPPGVGAMYGFDDPRGNEAITNTLLVETYPQWCTPLTAAYNRVNDLSKPFLDVMNVKYALATTTDQLPPEGWRVIARDRDSLLLENVNAKPRAFIESGEGTLKTRRAPNGLAIDATIVRDANVVISQTAWNGWRATIDDQPLSLRHAHHAFLGMTIPRGSHRVRLTYMPRAFVIGRAISFTTLALLGVAAIVIRARRK